MATAADFQRAFQIDIPTTEIINRAQALADAAEQRKIEQKRQADADAMAFEKYNHDKYGMATGTPYDNFANDKLKQADSALYEAQSKSKTPLTFAQRTAITAPYLYGLDRKAQMAIQTKKDMEEMNKRILAEHPYLDAEKLHAATNFKAFYDEKGNILDTPNVEGVRAFGEGMGNAMNQLPYVNKDDFYKKYRSNYDAMYPETAGTFPNKEKTHQYNFKTRGDLTIFDPVSGTVKINAAPVYDETKTQVGMELPKPVYDKFMSVGDNQIATAFELDRLRNENEGFNKLPVDQQNRMAAFDVINRVNTNSPVSFGKTPAYEASLDANSERLRRKNEIRSDQKDTILFGNLADKQKKVTQFATLTNALEGNKEDLAKLKESDGTYNFTRFGELEGVNKETNRIETYKVVAKPKGDGFEYIKYPIRTSGKSKIVGEGVVIPKTEVDDMVSNNQSSLYKTMPITNGGLINNEEDVNAIQGIQNTLYGITNTPSRIKP